MKYVFCCGMWWVVTMQKIRKFSANYLLHATVTRYCVIWTTCEWALILPWSTIRGMTTKSSKTEHKTQCLCRYAEVITETVCSILSRSLHLIWMWACQLHYSASNWGINRFMQMLPMLTYTYLHHRYTYLHHRYTYLHHRYTYLQYRFTYLHHRYLRFSKLW